MTVSYKQWHNMPKCQAGDFYKYPRTLVDAFPCDVSQDICIPYEPMSKADRIMSTVLVVVLVVVAGLFFTGVIT
jgi:hypothetical protein